MERSDKQTNHQSNSRQSTRLEKRRQPQDRIPIQQEQPPEISTRLSKKTPTKRKQDKSQDSSTPTGGKNRIPPSIHPRSNGLSENQGTHRNNALKSNKTCETSKFEAQHEIRTQDSSKPKSPHVCLKRLRPNESKTNPEIQQHLLEEKTAFPPLIHPRSNGPSENVFATIGKTPVNENKVASQE